MLTLTKLTYDNRETALKYARRLYVQAERLGRLHQFGKTAPIYFCAGIADWVWSRGKGGEYLLNTDLPIPPELMAIALAYGEFDVCIVNFYAGTHSQLNWHKDIDEVVNAPILNISLLGKADFYYRFNSKTENLTLNDGDVLLFGDEHRYIEHCVKLASDKRVSLTFRKIR